MSQPEAQWTRVGFMRVECPLPDCDATLPVEVRCRVVDVRPGQQNLVCEPDMTDVWAHHFTHASPSV